MDEADTEMPDTAEDVITTSPQEDYLPAVGGDEDMGVAEQEQLQNNGGDIEEDEGIETTRTEEVPDSQKQADEGENATKDVDEGEETEEEGEDETDNNGDEDDDNDNADEQGDTRQNHKHGSRLLATWRKFRP